MCTVTNNIYRSLLPNLLEIQRVSFCWFLERGLVYELENFWIGVENQSRQNVLLFYFAFVTIIKLMAYLVFEFIQPLIHPINDSGKQLKDVLDMFFSRMLTK